MRRLPALATLPIVENINRKISVDYGLVATPVFTKNYLVTVRYCVLGCVCVCVCVCT